MDKVELWLAKTDGSEFNRSSTRVVPCSLRSSLLTTVTGATEVTLTDCGMREPVTTTSGVAAASAGAAGVPGAVCA